MRIQIEKIEYKNKIFDIKVIREKRKTLNINILSDKEIISKVPNRVSNKYVKIF